MADILATLKKLAPHGNSAIINGIAPFISKYANQYKVNTDLRLKHFLSQAAHETDGFKTLREYASGNAYEGRVDLGNTQPGDGVKFAGRGIFQTTGRSNYATASKKLFNDLRLLDHPEILQNNYEAAVRSAFIYWDSKGLNTLADKNDIKGITKKINGGYNGLQDRMNYFDRLKNWVIENKNAITLLIAGIGLLGIGLYFFTKNQA